MMTTKSEEARSASHTQDIADRYWKRNLRLVLILLAIWWFVSYGMGIFWAGALDSITIPGTGFKLGFWFAQQGSIYVFVVEIFIYAWLMNKLDREFDVHED
jgi:putative solute:sodium symporter small subunit